MTTVAFTIFVYTIPTVNLQVEGREKKKKDLSAKMLFSSSPRLTMPLKRVKGNRKRNSNNAIVAILVGSGTTTN